VSGDRRIDFEEPQQVEVRGDREWRLLIVLLHFCIPPLKTIFSNCFTFLNFGPKGSCPRSSSFFFILAVIKYTSIFYLAGRFSGFSLPNFFDIPMMTFHVFKLYTLPRAISEAAVCIL